MFRSKQRSRVKSPVSSILFASSLCVTEVGLLTVWDTVSLQGTSAAWWFRLMWLDSIVTQVLFFVVMGKSYGAAERTTTSVAEDD